MNTSSTPIKPLSARKPLERVLHVIAMNQASLANLESVYRSDNEASASLLQAVEVISAAHSGQGKVVVTGVGKSAIIGSKCVACFNSLGIPACFLHPTDALHGDLGILRSCDVVVMISFSGRTPELLKLLAHLPMRASLIILTALVDRSGPLVQQHRKTIIVATPIHEPENVSFGVSLPSTSSAVALVMCDSLALAVAHRIHTSSGKDLARIFHSHHPGGAIGADVAAARTDRNGGAMPKVFISQLATPVTLIPTASASAPHGKICAADVLRAAVRAQNGWVCTGYEQYIGPRRIQKLRESVVMSSQKDQWAPTKGDLIYVPDFWTLGKCQQSLFEMRQGEQKGKIHKGAIVAVVTAGQINGVVEIEDIIGHGSCGECEEHRSPNQEGYCRSNKL